MPHPLISKKAGRVARMYDLRKGNLSSALLVPNKAAIKRANDYVDDRVDLKDRHKVNQRKTKDVKNKVSDINKKYAGRKGY